MRINNAPKYIRRRVNVAFWGTVMVALTVWIVPMAVHSLDSWLGV